MQALPSLEAIDGEINRRLYVKATDSFHDYTLATYPGLEPGWHLEELCWELQEFAAAIERKESPRLIVQMPPRHTKSTTASQRFVTWAMAKFGWHVLLASYGQDLADEQSLGAIEVGDSDAHRAIFPHTWQQSGTGKKQRTSATQRIRRWTMRGLPRVSKKRGEPIPGRLGKFACAGLEGGFTGKGAHLFVIDDPHKSRKDANSEQSRKNVKSFFTSVADTRMEPGGGILIIMTRWHSDDLAGWQQTEAKKPGGEQWRVVNFPAIAEEDEYSRRDGRLLRKKGEALHPARYDLEYLKKKETKDPYEFAALYQQRPIPAEGGMIKPKHLSNVYEPVQWVGIRPLDRVSPSSPLLQVPGIAKGALRIVSADTATKVKQLNDYTAIGSAVEIGLQVVLADVTQRRVEFPELCELMISICERDDPHVVLIEDKGSGQQLIQQLPAMKDKNGKRRWRWSIVPIMPVDDKKTRMFTETPWLEAGRLMLPASAAWRPAFDSELLIFTGDDDLNDDQVDMLSQLLAYLRIRTGSSLKSLYSWD